VIRKKSSRIQIPDPWGKKVPDTGAGPATLKLPFPTANFLSVRQPYLPGLNFTIYKFHYLKFNFNLVLALGSEIRKKSSLIQIPDQWSNKRRIPGLDLQY
jgi:hypothetical protein